MWNVVGGIVVGAVALAVAQRYIEDYMQRGTGQGQNSEGASGSTKLPKQPTDVVPRTGDVTRSFLDAARKVVNRAKK